MATNKNQHFVPRCYLRAFSKNGDGVTLNLYNIDRKKVIENAPLKNQCSKDYFYGEDKTLERAIQMTEANYGKTIREVLSPGYKLTDTHKSFLRLFWLMQYMRTESASRKQVEMFAAMDSSGGGMPEGFVPSIKKAVQISMHVFATNMDAVSDLKVCLIKNKSKIKFWTSDDPAVMANRWYQADERARATSFGIGASGLLSILPLSERVLFLAYDGDVYSIPNKSGWAVCNSDSDARAFNQFQFYNCRANIFFRDIECAKEVESSFEEASPHRPSARHKIQYAVLDSSNGDYDTYLPVSHDEAACHEESLVHVQQVYPVPTRWPSQIRWRSRGAVFTNGTGVGYVRKLHALGRVSHRAFWREPAKINRGSRKQRR